MSNKKYVAGMRLHVVESGEDIEVGEAVNLPAGKIKTLLEMGAIRPANEQKKNEVKENGSNSPEHPEN